MSEARDEAEPVPIDAKGRVAIPKRVRDRLGISPDEKLQLWVEDGEIHLSPILRKPTRVKAGRKWGKEAFMNAGEALFAGEE
jgi:AbrB family looped-hinge helix DNA binding protein